MGISNWKGYDINRTIRVSQIKLNPKPLMSVTQMEEMFNRIWGDLNAKENYR
jgi:hypothetical protein